MVVDEVEEEEEEVEDGELKRGAMRAAAARAAGVAASAAARCASMMLTPPSWPLSTQSRAARRARITTMCACIRYQLRTGR